MARREGIAQGATTTTRRGFTMIELAVVMAIIVILAALAVPSLSGLTRVSSEAAMRTALRGLCASARAISASKQSYVGIRFQQDSDGQMWAVMLVPPPQNSPAFPGGCPLYAQDSVIVTLVAAEAEPAILPRGVEVARGDLSTWKRKGAGTGAAAEPDNAFTADPNWVPKAIPATTFTVLFSPAGQIVRKQVHVAQRADKWDNFSNRLWSDPVFNLAGAGKFPPDVKDDNQSASAAAGKDTDADPQFDGPNVNNQKDTGYSDISQGSIWIYEHQKRVETVAKPFSGYIQNSGILTSLNVYTGAPVNTQQ